MKSLFKRALVKASSITAILIFILQDIFCQESSQSTATTATTTETSQTWYDQTWLWAAGAVIGILLLIAIIRMATNKRTDKVVVTKTTTTDV
jgi:TRAP-type C4-dicarboxylate transport system permease small subunit